MAIGPVAVVRVAILFVALSILVTATDRCRAQTTRKQPTLGLQEQAPPPPPSQPAAIEPPAPPAREENPGLLNEMGKLFEKILPLKSSGSDAAARPNDPRDGAAEGPADATKDNPKDSSNDSALSRLAKPSTMVSGRAVCPLAANRTPDCKLGADKLCQSKGYKEGKSLNTDSAESCSAKVLIPGRQRKPDDCHNDTYVTSALCQ
jgi:hypothetical protein